MIHCNTQFGKLKHVVVGRELEISSRLIDFTFNNFFKENLGHTDGMYNSRHEAYSISDEILKLRNQQLDHLSDVLTSFGIVVDRPDKIVGIKQIKTPTYATECSSANNVRDITLVYNDTIVETPVCIRNRVFENLALYKVFAKAFDNGNGGKWIKSPNTHLVESTYDLVDWKKPRDFTNINPMFEMAIDAPNFLTIGRDVIVNIATDIQYLGYSWVKSLFPESKFHLIKCADNHIDGELVCLKPGTFLLNPMCKGIISQLPDKFKKWKFIIPEDLTEIIDTKGMTDIDIQLASSRGMDMNVLSIDENTVLVNKKAVGIKKALEENGFSIIEIELDNGEIFGGGIHCSTLDIIREDEYAFY